MGLINGSSFLLYKSDIDPKVALFAERVGADSGTMEALNCIRDTFEDEKQVLGHSSSTAISLSVDLPESTTKDSSGFREVIAGVRSGEIVVDGLVDYSDALNFEELSTMMLSRQKAEFYFQDSLNSQLIFNGEGFIESVEQIAEVENTTSFSVDISLTGLIVLN